MHFTGNICNICVFDGNNAIGINSANDTAHIVAATGNCTGNIAARYADRAIGGFRSADQTAQVGVVGVRTGNSSRNCAVSNGNSGLLGSHHADNTACGIVTGNRTGNCTVGKHRLGVHTVAVDTAYNAAKLVTGVGKEHIHFDAGEGCSCCGACGDRTGCATALEVGIFKLQVLNRAAVRNVAEETNIGSCLVQAGNGVTLTVKGTLEGICSRSVCTDGGPGVCRRIGCPVGGIAFVPGDVIIQLDSSAGKGIALINQLYKPLQLLGVADIHLLTAISIPIIRLRDRS